MGACCTKDYMYGKGYLTCEKDGKDSNGEDEGEEVRRGEDGATVRLGGSSAFTSMFSQRGRKGINQDAMTSWEVINKYEINITDDRISQGRKIWCFVEFLMVMVHLVIRLLAKHEKCCPRSLPRQSRSSYLNVKLRLNRWFPNGKLRLLNLTKNVIKNSAAIHLLIVSVVEQQPSPLSNRESIWSLQTWVTPGRFSDADYPGLAMSRSLGDFCLKDYGVISTPQFTTNLQIWDVLTNKQVINIVATAINRSVAAKLVVKVAVREWKRRFPGAMIDDCTVICLFFKSPPLLIRSMTSVGRRNMRSHQELVSRSCRSVGIDRKRGGEEESKEDWKGIQGLSRANSLTRIPRFARSLSNNHNKMAKFHHEVEAR